MILRTWYEMYVVFPTGLYITCRATGLYYLYSNVLQDCTIYIVIYCRCSTCRSGTCRSGTCRSSGTLAAHGAGTPWFTAVYVQGLTGYMNKCNTLVCVVSGID